MSSRTGKTGEWNVPADVKQMRATYAGFGHLIRKLVGKFTSCLRWTLADLPSLQSRLSKYRKLVLIGDEAHAMVPFFGARRKFTEEGACLAVCLGRVETPGEVPCYLGVFWKVAQATWRKQSSWALGQMETCGTFRTVQSRSCETVLYAEMGFKEDARPNVGLDPGNPNPWSNKDFQPWLFRNDVFKEANEAFDRRNN